MASGADFVSTARFISASVERARSLAAEQNHEAARGVALGLRRLASGIRAAQPERGFMADLVLGEELAAIDALAVGEG